MKRLILPIIALCLTPAVKAAGIPTIDVTNIVQTTISALENVEQTVQQAQQIQNQVDQITNQLEQIQQLRDQYETLTGDYGLGDLLNGTIEKDLRRYTPRNWEETLAIYQVGGLPGSQNDAVVAARRSREEGEDYTADDIFSNVDNKKARMFLRNAARIYSTMGVSQSAFEKTNQRLDTVEELSNNIDTAVDLKAAVDLGNRVDIEQAVLLNELVRQINILNLQMAETREYGHNQLAGDHSAFGDEIPTW